MQRLDIEADSVYDMACIASYQGDIGCSRALGEQAHRLYDSLNNLPGKMRSLNLLGNADHGHGDYLSAIPYYEQALSLCSQLGNHGLEGVLLRNLAGAWQCLGDLTQAQDLYGRSIKCCPRSWRSARRE